ncbi:FAD-dependent oxidoreductase [Acidaminobacter sp. JC074]|uniref:FAD-dependent oxidoreductase n=1 Tax=Acidaminobacter sp. JC074 TaxID=2530199 RepID=UPI001F1169D4|nr:FAD-dependent oxidoreductase [Acidaminobacter sp. JC074]MCH4889207.1 FAD-dependent oxidoreductase [Acidaminobacter sp. JC074]
MKITDFKGIFKKTYAYIESVDNPFGDYYVIKLKAQGLSWTSGEHAIFSLPDHKVTGKKWRAFSIASSNHEGVITLGMRTGEKISSFKDTLIHMKKGERVQVRGPFGWFKVMDNKAPMVMIASGVGITPIRAIMKSLENDESRPLHTVYSSRKDYLFSGELEEIVAKNQSMELIKTTSRDATSDEYKRLAKLYGNEAYYYISGSMQVIKSIKDALTKEGVKKNRIINDPFFGY